MNIEIIGGDANAQKAVQAKLASKGFTAETTAPAAREESGHTPGPWRASNRFGNFGDHNRHEADAPVGQASRFSFSVADSEGFIIAHGANPLVTMSSERSEANARLIAAAPEMLDALGLALATLERLAPPKPFDSTQGTRDIINAAIARATGKEEK